MAFVFLSLSAHMHHKVEIFLSLLVFMLWMNSQIRSSSDCPFFGFDILGIFRALIRQTKNSGENVCWLPHE